MVAPGVKLLTLPIPTPAQTNGGFITLGRVALRLGVFIATKMSLGSWGLGREYLNSLARYPCQCWFILYIN